MEISDLTKKYYKIKDAAEIVGVPQSTIRFWEKEFDEIKPRRSAHNQRYFTPQDIQVLRMIKFLIKDKGMKIDAAREYLRKNRHNVSKKMEIVEKLGKVKEELEGLLRALNLRAAPLGIEESAQ